MAVYNIIRGVPLCESTPCMWHHRKTGRFHTLDICETVKVVNAVQRKLNSTCFTQMLLKKKKTYEIAQILDEQHAG